MITVAASDATVGAAAEALDLDELASAFSSSKIANEEQIMCSSQSFQKGPTNKLFPNQKKKYYNDLLCGPSIPLFGRCSGKSPKTKRKNYLYALTQGYKMF